MRANLPVREPEILARWERMQLYRRIQEANAGRPKFILHDGPPYANNHIHLGQALNKILKDFIVKLKSMSGFLAPYVPGWDCHGLPIELQVEKTLEKDKSQIEPAEIIARCREHALRFMDIQREEFKRLGVFADWDHPYLTLDRQYEAAEVRELGRFMTAGVLYRRKKPVYWCASCATALAEAEVEYADHASPSIYVAFPIRDSLPVGLAPLTGRDVSVLIWTTTPWTLPANLAIAFHPDFEYVAVEVGSKLYIVAGGLVDATARALRWRESPREIVRVRGAELAGGRARHPWLPRDSVFLLADHVTLEQGTGCVHTAPGHGHEDYELGVANGLEVYCPVDARGRFTNEVPDFAGQYVFDADRAVLAKLREAGALLAEEPYQHSYPHCWRCKQPVIFRATEQWFIAMDESGLRQRALAEIDRVRWIPPWGRDRIRGMMESRPDWCISRQRVWGVPIPAVYCEGCGAAIADPRVAEHAAERIAEHGSSIWYTGSNDELLPPGFRCPTCGSAELRRERDILDVWFDSGVSHAAVVEVRPELGERADLYLEGSDQHRGWFHTSLLTAVGTGRPAPYEAVLTHGFFVDAEGKKMSKSLGNVVAPKELTNKYGAEVLRLWVSAADYRDDMRISQEILDRLLESYRRMRNTARFLLGNLYDYTPDQDRVVLPELPELDRWVLHRTQLLAARCRQAYDDYEFHLVYHGLNNFCVVDLSALYLDIVKDRLYCSAANSRERRAAQTALWQILETLARLMAPILSFTAEEIWLHAPARAGKAESVFLAGLPEVDPAQRDDALAARWDRLLDVRAAVTKALEEARKDGRIGHSLDARVLLAPSDGLRPALVEVAADLPTLFIVSQVELVDELATETSPLLGDLKIQVERARGGKCERCWNFSEAVGSHADHPGLCGRCLGVVSALG